jgi:hypothetical protein
MTKQIDIKNDGSQISIVSENWEKAFPSLQYINLAANGNGPNNAIIASFSGYVQLNAIANNANAYATLYVGNLEWSTQRVNNLAKTSGNHLSLHLPVTKGHYIWYQLDFSTIETYRLHYHK